MIVSVFTRVQAKKIKCMTDLENPFWYRLITNLKANGEILNGVTIPFILGAQEIKDNTLVIREESIYVLLTEIMNSSTELKVILQNCEDIHEYVIGLRDKYFCEHYLKSDLSFTNEKGDKTIYVALTAIKLGNTIHEISNNLTKKYWNYLKNNYFSWDKYNQTWRIFSQRERDLISKL